MSRAFLTINPLWEGDVRTNTIDEFVVDLNAGQKYSLLENPGKYTLTIATFSGSSVIQVGNEKSAGGSNYSARDPEGNVWSFGNYDPWADPV